MAPPMRWLIISKCGGGWTTIKPYILCTFFMTLQTHSQHVGAPQCNYLYCLLQETLDSLCELYSLLKEEDLLVGLWQKRAKFAETSVALAYEQHGFFEQAQQSYEQVITLWLLLMWTAIRTNGISIPMPELLLSKDNESCNVAHIYAVIGHFWSRHYWIP